MSSECPAQLAQLVAVRSVALRRAERAEATAVAAAADAERDWRAADARVATLIAQYQQLRATFSAGLAKLPPHHRAAVLAQIARCGAAAADAGSRAADMRLAHQHARRLAERASQARLRLQAQVEELTKRGNRALRRRRDRHEQAAADEVAELSRPGHD